MGRPALTGHGAAGRSADRPAAVLASRSAQQGPHQERVGAGEQPDQTRQDREQRDPGHDGGERGRDAAEGSAAEVQLRVVQGPGVEREGQRGGADCPAPLWTARTPSARHSTASRTSC